jgi:hypothetical protein
MVKVRRLTTGAAALAVVVAVVLLAAQVASAAPAAKVGTSYWKNGSADVTALWSGPIVTMEVPAGKYHLTSSVTIDNNVPGQGAGAYVNRLDCSLTAYGVTVDYKQTSVPGGGYASLTLDGVVDGSRSTTGVTVYVDCRGYDTTAPLPLAEVNLVGDAMAAIVDLR